MYTLYSQVLRKVNKCEITELFTKSTISTCEMDGKHFAELPYNDLCQFALWMQKAKTGTGFLFLVLFFCFLQVKPFKICSSTDTSRLKESCLSHPASFRIK